MWIYRRARSSACDTCRHVEEWTYGPDIVYYCAHPDNIYSDYVYCVDNHPPPESVLRRVVPSYVCQKHEWINVDIFRCTYRRVEIDNVDI